MSKIKKFKNIKIFQLLPDSSLEDLAPTLTELQCKKGDFIIHRNEPGKHMYFISSGKVRIRVPEKQDIFMEEGDFFGEMALISGAPRGADVLADSDVKLLALSRQAFETELSTQPVFSRLLTQVFADRLGSRSGSMEDKKVGEFMIHHEIGRGEMGIFYYGTHMTLEMPVAIKMLSHNFVFDANGLKRFLNEAKVIAGLNHMNIRYLLDIEQAYGTYFIVMQYVDGIPLLELLKDRELISYSLLREIFLQIARGLTFAHSRGVTHRAIKPGNILINDQGEVKITDFGIAYTNKDNLQKIEDLSLGTPYYVSPEQINGEELNHLTDIYSFGVLCYKTLTGKYPFYGADTITVLSKHLNEDYIPPEEINPAIPADLRILIKRCLEKDREKRLQSLYNLQEKLHIWAFGEEVSETISEVLVEMQVIDNFRSPREHLAKFITEYKSTGPKEETLPESREPFELEDEAPPPRELFEMKMDIGSGEQGRKEVEQTGFVKQLIFLEKKRQECTLIQCLNKKLSFIDNFKNLGIFLKNFIKDILKDDYAALILQEGQGSTYLYKGGNYAVEDEEEIVEQSGLSLKTFRDETILSQGIAGSGETRLILVIICNDGKKRYSPRYIFSRLEFPVL